MTAVDADRAACQTMLDQIGRMNLLAISGGRVARVAAKTISLPVAHGYSVEVEYLAGSDTYTVRRLWKRGATIKVKGEATGVYAAQLGETCYRASCYHDDWGKA